MEKLDTIVQEALQLFAGITDAAQLEQAKARYLGKAGALTELQKSLGKLSPAERPAMGARFNTAKEQIESALTAQRQKIQSAKLDAQLALEALDVTLAGRGIHAGGLHPVTRTLERMEALFHSIGFEVADGPEIETDYYNFTALNQPENHPARSMHDTFYVDDGRHLLRTHTSPIQIRYMETHRPPIKLIAPGRVYRVDSDATHSPMFHQIEGFLVDEHTSFAELKGVLGEFARRLYGPECSVRFRPSYFPFVEPGAEMDVSCVFCRPDDGSRATCRVCKASGWLEVLGAGMIHPEVFRHCGIDAERYRGFAFGLGVDRVAMLRYGIPDIRVLFDNDPRFLSQF